MCWPQLQQDLFDPLPLERYHRFEEHNVPEIYDTFLSVKDQNGPVAIVADTVKGKGFSFAENHNVWHHAPLSSSQYEAALEELKN